MLELYWIVVTGGLCYVAGWIAVLCVVVVLCLAVFGDRWVVCCVNSVVVSCYNIASYWVCVLPFGVIVGRFGCFRVGAIGFGQ